LCASGGGVGWRRARAPPPRRPAVQRGGTGTPGAARPHEGRDALPGSRPAGTAPPRALRAASPVRPAAAALAALLLAVSAPALRAPAALPSVPGAPADAVAQA